MMEFLRTAMQCLKGHRFAAYIVGCMVFVTVTVLSFVFLQSIFGNLMQYKDFSINLFNLIQIEASR